MVEVLLLVRGDTSGPPYGIILAMVSGHYLCLDHFTNKNTLYSDSFFGFLHVNILFLLFFYMAQITNYIYSFFAAVFYS